MLDSISLNLLQRTKLNEKQARVYLAVLQLGRPTVADIAELADLKRPSCYLVLEELLREGYLNLVPGTKIQRYVAVDPNALASELESAAHDFKEMLPYLRSQQRKAGKPQVTYYNGVEGLKRAFAQIKRPKEVRYATSISVVQKRVPEEVEHWQKLYTQGKARPGGKHLLTNTDADHHYGRVISEAEQVVRYLDKDQALDMDLALLDGQVVLTAFDEDIHVTVIDSPALYSSMVSLYDLAWKGGSSK